MLERLKQVLVESFVGAIGLGLLLSQALGHFANGLIMPFANWIARSEFRGFPNRPPPAFPLREGSPEFVRCCVLLLIGYLLLRWLYFKPVEEETSEQESVVETS